MTLRFAPEDARRGGLKILGAAPDEGERLAKLFAAVGYETVLGELPDGADLQPPVFVLALRDAASAAWSLCGVAAIVIVADSRIATVLRRAPSVPVMLYLEAAAHDRLAGTLEASHPDIAVHRFEATPDGERLLHLRALRHFATHAGGRGEV